MAAANGRIYSETGWGLAHYAPYIASQIDARFIHLVRDPRTWIGSWMAESIPSTKSHGATVMPEGDPMHDIYWNEWTPPQRSLWWWSEVNRFGLWAGGFRLRFEDMIAGKVEALFDWLGVSYDARGVAAITGTRWNHRNRNNPAWDDDWNRWLDTDLMAECGYE
jgi:hypothetical protein